MTMLKDISVIWSLIHTLILFMLLYESRFPKKKTLVLTLSAIVPLIVINFLLFIFWGTEVYMQRMLITLSLPSMIFFWILAKRRDGRFIFTFCMVDTMVLEIIYVTNIIDHYIPGHLFMFISRLLVYPLLELFIFKKFSQLYRDIQNQVKRGWTLFAFTGLMFYIAITLAMSYPTIITERMEYMPLFIILLILMPVSYINIFNALRHQQKAYQTQEQQNILQVQVSDIKNRLEEFTLANENFRHERHNLRHKLATISRMLENKEYDQLKAVVSKYGEAIEETKIKRYCENPVLDAVFSSYLHRAEICDIKVTANIRFPENLPADDIELATVLANAIENAIHACEKLPIEKRWIDIRILLSPKLMLRIENPFDGEIIFDESGIPTSSEEEHGFGTRSIVAFCNKYNCFYNFKSCDNKFTLQIIF